MSDEQGTFTPVSSEALVDEPLESTPMESNQIPLIEIGWIIAGKLDPTDLDAARKARQSLRDLLQQTFPQFHWKLPLLHRDELTAKLREEPVVLLDYGVIERNVKHWDYVLIITGADLESHYKSDTIAAISRALEGAVISTSRIDPRSSRLDVTKEQRVEVMARRIHVLALHALSHLAGLGHHEDPENYLFSFRTIEDLDRAGKLTEQQEEHLKSEIGRTSDRRLEEETSRRRAGLLTFYPRAIWLNRRQIVDAIVDAKPWEFPFRLSRLTATAFSAMVILLVTAEAWELGMSQSPADVVGLSLVSILLTTIYVLARQRLFVRRERSRLSEQTVVTNVSTLAIVLSGMLTTYLMLMSITLLLGMVFFPGRLVEGWVPSLSGEVTTSHYFILAAFVASLGICIGALGASFEQHSYFRHVTFVDEEI